MGGWSLSPHHIYDPAAQVLYQGDGTRRDAQALGRIITTVAGDGNFCFAGFGSCGDGGPATKAQLTGAYHIALGPDGSLYIPDRDNSRVRRVGPDGIITTVVGTGGCGFSGDGGPATQAKVCQPFGVTVGPDGSL